MDRELSFGVSNKIPKWEVDGKDPFSQKSKERIHIISFKLVSARRQPKSIHELNILPV